MGNIVKRVLKVIREVSRGELETDGREDRAEVTPDYSSVDEEEEDEEEDQDTFDTDMSQSPNTTTRPELTTQTSMFRLLADMSTLTVREHKREQNEKRIRDTYNLKPLIIQEITEEIIADLDTIYKGIADQALDFIHAK